MTQPLKCTAWIITVSEPTTAAFPSRLKAQEDYLGTQLAPWLLDTPPAWLTRCHSFHFMRYIDASHEGHGGITVELRFLGSADVLAEAAPEVERALSEQQASGAITKSQGKEVSGWRADDAYGGTTLNEPFAHLLASSSRLALELLREPRRDFAARKAVVQNWTHCVRLIASGMG